MLKTTEQNDKLKRTIILSIMLHCVLIVILIWSSIYQTQESSTGRNGFIDAVMVDPGTVVRQYKSQQQANAQWTQQQAEELQQKRTVALQSLRKLENQRLNTHKAAKTQQRAVTEQQKQAQEATKQASSAAKKAAAQNANKQSNEMDALLNSLIQAKKTPKAVSLPAEANKAKQNNVSGGGVDNYKAQVSRAISDKFYDSSSYSGRRCDLRIKLAPNGLLIWVTAVGGDPALCQAAVSAAKLAIIPRPPSPQVYEVLKNATLRFSPQ